MADENSRLSYESLDEKHNVPVYVTLFQVMFVIAVQFGSWKNKHAPQQRLLTVHLLTIIIYGFNKTYWSWAQVKIYVHKNNKEQKRRGMRAAVTLWKSSTILNKTSNNDNNE